MDDQTTGKTRFQTLPLGRKWCEAIQLEDGRQLLLRPIQPSDARTLQRSFQTLTPQEIRMRFMHPISELSGEYAKRLCSVDDQEGFALVVVEAKPPEEALIGAVARLAIDDAGHEAEFAIIVGRELRRLGLGRYLMQHLIAWAGEKGLKAIYGFILDENRPMLRLMNEMGFSVGPSDIDTGISLARYALDRN